MLAILFSMAASSPPPLPTIIPAEATLQLSRTLLPLSPTSMVAPTAESTMLPAGTSTVSTSPTSTPDAVQLALANGGLTFTGPLSNAQQIALYRSSLNYVRSNAHDSRRLAKEINGVGYGDPSNICGPLAIAIMRDAGLIDNGTSPHDFWLLNPLATTDQQLLRRVFPSSRYLYTKLSTPINKMDWQSFPLEPGDFLFIWHGSGGNFDHMLVVNRVDANLRPYAVTNYGTSDGFVIAETLLYDINDPEAGIFHTWTKEREAILGSTGFGGFELWRLRSP